MSPKQFANLKTILSGSSTLNQLQKNIVKAPFNDKILSAIIDLGIVVLLAVNKKTKTIDRIALSDTALSKN